MSTGVSRGGKTSKIHTAVDEKGRPRKIILTAGNVNDCDVACELFNGSAKSMVKLLIFLRLTAELLRKQQIQRVLSVGEWNELNSALARFLPQFNAENFLYNFAKSKPIEKFDNTKFIFADEEEILFAENKFSTIILSQPLLSPEIFLAVKDFGKLFFAATKNSCPDFLKNSSQIFEIENNFAVFEVTVTPELKNIFILGTAEGQLAQKKNFNQASC